MESPTCPECGFMHPPSADGVCPIKNPPKEIIKPEVIKSTIQSSNNVEQPKEIQSDSYQSGNIEFKDMTDKLEIVAMNQIKMKEISDPNEIAKIKQYIIIEVTKAFERYKG